MIVLCRWLMPIGQFIPESQTKKHLTIRLVRLVTRCKCEFVRWAQATDINYRSETESNKVKSLWCLGSKKVHEKDKCRVDLSGDERDFWMGGMLAGGVQQYHLGTHKMVDRN